MALDGKEIGRLQMKIARLETDLEGGRGDSTRLLGYLAEDVRSRIALNILIPLHGDKPP